MDLDPGTRVYLKAGGHVDVRPNPWQVAYMLWGRHESDERPGITNADAADMGYGAHRWRQDPQREAERRAGHRPHSRGLDPAEQLGRRRSGCAGTLGGHGQRDHAVDLLTTRAKWPDDLARW